MPSLFTKIINGEIPCYKIAENEDFLAFLDINPVENGHTLVVPKEEIDYIFDISEKKFGNFWVFTQKIAKAIKQAIPCTRVGIAVVGLEVPHAHIHLIPINNITDLSFTRPRKKLTQNEMEEIVLKITKFL